MTDQPKPRLSAEELANMMADMHDAEERCPEGYVPTCTMQIGAARALLAMATELVRLESACAHVSPAAEGERCYYVNPSGKQAPWVQHWYEEKIAQASPRPLCRRPIATCPAGFGGAQ